VRLWQEHGFIDCFQNGPDHFLDEAIFNSRDAQRPHLAIGLWDIDPSDRTRAVGAFRDPPGEAGQFLQRHAVEGLTVHTRRERPFVPGHPVVCPLEEEW
jgi:hypothetical protein